MNNFHYIGVLLDMLYGIELDSEDLEEIGLIGWNLIGNKNTRLYRYCDVINPIDNSITLPCNILNGGCVEAVTSSYEDWERTTNKDNLGNPHSAFVENYIETQKFYDSPYYISGKLLKYQQVGDKLYFNHNYGRVNILYKGILMDEEGLPEISDKEATAIATYIAYTQKFKLGLVNNSGDLINQANLLKAQWLQQCDQARVTYLNQNDMNNIINVSHNWNRAAYNKSYKPVP